MRLASLRPGQTRGRFNPRPALRPGDATKSRRVPFRWNGVSIRARP